MKGSQCGNDNFMKKLERLPGRRLRALPWENYEKTNK
ncbi:MAG: hypothetical protein SCARUB_04232 [Candidatus Scalindua rubra]|uniref:Uncharacterized protein n=1 Tax=Candidatus Scalindua rubra TaxID=1872076 RepID=A0A1E3X531_9BACT|nr:MAG: hypothetical protein SCARUB_04232 [Candidatus Scalindua rubra]